MHGLLTHHRLGSIGDTHARSAHHLEVVGAVSDGDGTGRFDPEARGQSAELRGLAVRVHNVAQHASCETARLGFESVGHCVVEPEAGLKSVGEVGEPSGDEQGFPARLLGKSNEFLRSG